MLQFYLDQEVSNAFELNGLHKRIYVVDAIKYTKQLLIFQVGQMLNE